MIISWAAPVSVLCPPTKHTYYNTHHITSFRSEWRLLRHRLTTSSYVLHERPHLLLLFLLLLLMFQPRQLHPQMINAFFPQRYFLFTGRHCQHVARNGPAHSPHGFFKIGQFNGLPTIRGFFVDPYCFVFRAGSNRIGG